MILSQLCYGSNSFFPGLSAHVLGQLEKMFKACIRTTLQQWLLTPTAPLLSLLSIVSLPHTYTHKIVLFVHRCINTSCSPLLQQIFTRTPPQTVPEDQRTTRGQVSNLLQVPFLRGPAGRSTMMFRGSILWNALPSDFRVIGATLLQYCREPKNRAPKNGQAKISPIFKNSLGWIFSVQIRTENVMYTIQYTHKYNSA